jgi:flagellar assembly protein FliH
MSGNNSRGHSAYQDQLREVRPMAQPSQGSVVSKPRWQGQLEDGYKPLFELLTCLDEPKEDPEAELARIRQAAYREGYQEGLQRGGETIQAIVEKYQTSMMELETVRDEILVQTEQDLVDLSLLIAEQILAADTEGARDFTLRMTEHVLKLLRDADMITLKVGPKDMEQVKKRHPEMVSDKTVVRLIEDPSIQVGGLIAECNLGRVDATIQRRLTDIAESLIGSGN